MDKENKNNIQILIKRVVMENFMIHENMKVEFNKKVTCLTGANGSGKSTVMMAIGVVFGLRAQLMGRQTLNDFIRTGKDFCVIKVTINNHKKLIYDQGEITIVKKVHRNKPSELFIEVGNRKEKLSSIKFKHFMDEMSLNFTNPINFLTQDNSKRILSDSSARDLYNFYYEGSDFKSLEEEIFEGQAKIEEMVVKIKQTQERLENTLKEKECLKRDLDFVSMDHPQMLLNLENEEKWVEIHNLQSALREKENNLQSKKLELQKCVEYMVNLSKDLEINKELPTEELRQKIYKVEREVAQLKTDIEIFSKEFGDKKQDLEQKKARSSKQKLEEMQKLLNDKLNKHKNILTGLEDSEKEIYSKHLQEQERNSLIKKEIEQKQRELEVLKSSKSQSEREKVLRRFTGIKQQIAKNSHLFQDEILGPICECMDVTERIWRRVAMVVTKGSFGSFVVFNQNDKNLLQRLFKDANFERGSVLLLSNKNRIEFTKRHTHKTLLDVLKINHPCVEKVLITMHNVEESVLCEERKEAYEIAKNTSLGVNCVYLPAGDKIKRFGNSFSDFTERNIERNTFFEDNKTLINTIENRLSKLTLQSEAQKEYLEYKKMIAKEKIKVGKLLDAINENTLELQTYDEFKDDEFEKIEKKLQILNQQNKMVKEKYEKNIELREKLVRELEEIEQKNSEIRRNIRLLENSKITQLNETRMKQGRLEHDIRRIENEKQEIVEFIDLKKKESGHEVSTTRSVDAIKTERAEIKAKLLQAKEIGTKEEIQEKIDHAESVRSKLMQILKTFDDTLKQTNDAIEARKHKKEEIKNVKTIEIADEFKKLTKESNYEGELVFHHDIKKLELNMKVHKNEIKGDKNTLSGGERTFAGTCLLLSMWKVFRCPFKILDEFDVFMDATNRKKAIELIFDFAGKENIQLLLITPHNVTDFKEKGADILAFLKNDK